MPAAPPTSTSLTLLDVAEPLFQYIARLNRAARRSVGAGATPTGGSIGDTAFFSKPATGTAPSFAARSLSMDYAIVRSEVKALLEDMVQKAASDFRLASQARKVEEPLMYFVDSMICESRLPFTAQWNQNRLAYERNELAGDEKFFDIVDETLKDPSEEASERLSVLYVCLGMGFTGIYFRQPEFLRKTMLAIAPRIRHLIDSEQMARICPETYEHIDTRNLIRPPSNRLVVVAILFLCFTLAVVVSYVFMYRDASDGLNSALRAVLAQEPAKK
ncbi:MAG: DotU family type IV/VI secretion system protein [Verrucomicrobia bacterium]|nr:DotU family type IV/VI secretion system protein [Verrucomicrobiota bacterium]